MLDPLLAAVGSAITIALSAGAAYGRALTPAAATVAGAFGVAIVTLSGFGFLGVLVGFVVVSSLATRYRFDEKKRRNVQEGTSGERGVSNVLAHIVLPTALAVSSGLGWFSATTAAVLFGAAFSFALADTLASEFGVLSGSARSILSLRPVTPGTNGGISAVGTAFAAGGATTMAVLGALAFSLSRTPYGVPLRFLVAVAVAGFVACQVDSVLGEVLENRGYLTKGSTNFLGMFAAIAVAAAFLPWVGFGT